ncbi:MAG: DUF167 domain-containing protein [Nanoarchaeota archaeon]|nr:DUF167 domain-containing protein [Nanoarchaeota archaeon]MBU4451802.1 DUF167 domain-containing protein [Nanoarchaeota archaeon]MCG2723469.1 DUF167 domain-containing protein [archaeon]
MFEIKGNNVMMSVTVKPLSHRFKILVDENRIIICLKSIPEDNKANIELIKGLERLLKKHLSIVSGEKSKKKKLLIYNATESEIRRAFERSR